MRIAFVLPEIGPGGAERVATLLAGLWRRAGHQVTLLTMDDGSRPPFHPIPEGVEHRPLGLQRPSRGLLDALAANIGRVRRLRRAILAVSPEVAVSFIDQANVLTLLACRGTGIPVVASERVDPTLQPLAAPWRWLRRLTYPHAARLVAPTEAMARTMAPWSPRPVAVIANPVLAPRRFPDMPRQRLVLGVGRLVPQKGFDLLIAAFAQSMPAEWSLTIAGEGPERPALEALAARLGVADRVRLPGLVADLGPIYATAGLFVLSSRFEGFPNALGEAMAAGTPCVAADCPTGPAEIIRDGVDGVLVPAGGVEPLATAMARLAGDGALRTALGREAGAVCLRFAPERIAETWSALLHSAGGRD